MPPGRYILDALFEQPFFPSHGTGELVSVCLAPEVEGYYQLLQQPAFDAFAFHDEIESIKRLLQKLPARQARLCELYFTEDYTYEEIARFTNLSPTTVKNHIAWSMIILRNYMTKPKAPV